MDLSLFFAGTAGSVPSARRGLPAILLRRGGDTMLFDCGEGTQRQLIRSVGLSDLTHVFLTHFHADPDCGGLERGGTVNGVTAEQVIGPDRPGRKLVLSGDTAPCETLRVAAHQADVLVCESTFADDEAERAAHTGHSTARQAAEL